MSLMESFGYWRWEIWVNMASLPWIYLLLQPCWTLIWDMMRNEEKCGKWRKNQKRTFTNILVKTLEEEQHFFDHAERSLSHLKQKPKESEHIKASSTPAAMRLEGSGIHWGTQQMPNQDWEANLIISVCWAICGREFPGKPEGLYPESWALLSASRDGAKEIITVYVTASVTMCWWCTGKNWKYKYILLYHTISPFLIVF